MKKPKVGDIFEIPLSNGRKAYGQYLYFGKMGPIIQVFKLITKEDIPIQQIIEAKPLFPPVITGLFAAIKNKLWKVIGNNPVTTFTHPKFVSTLYNQSTGKAGIWFLWDGEKDIRLGTDLSPEYKGLEYLVVWNPKNITQRIESGEMPFPYGDLLKYNKFTPRS